MLTRRSTIGHPGAGPRHLARRRRLLAAVVVVAGVGLAALLLVAGLPAAGLLVVVAGLAGRAWLMRAAGRAAAGAHAEDRAAGGLARLRADVVVYNARLPGRYGDVDVVVLGPMAAAVEVKLGAGRVRVRRDGTVRVGGRTLPGRPLHQALAGAAAVRRGLRIAVEVDAVLCVTEMRGRPRLIDVDGWPVWVTSARHLRRVIRRLPGGLGREEALAAADGLD